MKKLDIYSILKLFFIFICAPLMIFSINSCDIIESGQYEKDFTIDTSSQSQRTQNILITEYTGHKCGNCPPAAEEARRIQSIFTKERVIFMGVHVGIFATPDENYPEDFRIKDGVTLNNTFGITTYPIGDVNRTKNSSGQRNLIHSEWESMVSSLIKKEASCVINFKDAKINNQTGDIQVKVDVEYFENVTTNDFITLYLVEDSIVSPQTDYRRVNEGKQDKVEDYVHYGVLRSSINGVFGEKVSQSTIKSKDKFSFDYTYKIPAGKNWRKHQLRIIALIHDNNQTFQISQVKDTHLTIE